MAKFRNKILLGTISVLYQNQNYLSKCTTNHRNFEAKVKTRVSVAWSSFGAKAKMTNFSPNILLSIDLQKENNLYASGICQHSVLEYIFMLNSNEIHPKMIKMLHISHLE